MFNNLWTPLLAGNGSKKILSFEGSGWDWSEREDREAGWFWGPGFLAEQEADFRRRKRKKQAAKEAGGRSFWDRKKKSKGGEKEKESKREEEIRKEIRGSLRRHLIHSVSRTEEGCRIQGAEVGWVVECKALAPHQIYWADGMQTQACRAKWPVRKVCCLQLAYQVFPLSLDQLLLFLFTFCSAFLFVTCSFPSDNLL